MELITASHGNSEQLQAVVDENRIKLFMVAQKANERLLHSHLDSSLPIGMYYIRWYGELNLTNDTEHLCQATHEHECSYS